ncbi:precorrin-2 dehydrogenase/sirohydrochlorin ferrochelatase family protein [Qiania dongpingensis]|uniref:precorrin-2 dehydrogenase n=1 Tax=Qiania dongpingensis TaxID=2763669 RepID=A0A7G9G2R8_9FIRM|nr:bifunctional precorrin-2 dehydrogenase/sirohydrochlorin ferrochelatase [Qiania dongpingensis]QNM05100.1 bifunctional precorrin-2 dehydrogenase/sirohydrochlorin ferrochelatase [Qiania dongpingensis]
MRFPMFVELEGKRVVVAGAGTIGTRRIRVLAEFGASVLVVAPEISDEVRSLWQAGKIQCELRPVEKQDMEPAYLVVAAADKREINHQVYEWCSEAGILVNVADKKEECSFYFPGIAKKGSLVAGICAGGENHRLARQAAEEIRELWKEKAGV